jgi:hypothetical protein
MGFAIRMVPGKAEGGSRTAGVLEASDNAARDHLGAETAVADPRGHGLASLFPTTSATGSVHEAAGGQPLQLDELQPQRLDPGDEAVQRRTVGHPTHQHGVGRGLVRCCERVEHLQHHWRQPAGDPETVLSAHVVLTSDRGVRTSAGAPKAIVGATG